MWKRLWLPQKPRAIRATLWRHNGRKLALSALPIRKKRAAIITLEQGKALCESMGGNACSAESHRRRQALRLSGRPSPANARGSPVIPFCSQSA
jgi:hypothetical protein